MTHMPKQYSVCLILGDGIGPEIVAVTLDLLDFACDKFGIALEYTEVPGGDSALKKYGDPLPKQSIEAFENTDVCLKGPVGETVGTLNNKLRFNYDLYANLRPAQSYPGVSPPALRPDIDLMVIRENSEGFYKALENEISPGVWTSTGVFTEKGARRIAELSFKIARTRKEAKDKEDKKKNKKTTTKKSKVTLATKANIFRNSHGMYVRVLEDVAGRDLAGQVAGGLGLTPGTNINYETRRAYFEPTHGSAPDIAGKKIADPIGQIRSGALMLNYLGMIHADENASKASLAIESAIGSYLNSTPRSGLPIELGGTSRTGRVVEMIMSYLEET
jgi:3-isopropylmalate dehydrogenase